MAWSRCTEGLCILPIWTSVSISTPPKEQGTVNSKTPVSRDAGKVALCSVLLREASFHILSMSSPAALQPAASAGPGESSLEGASGFELPLFAMPTEAKAPKVTTFQFMTCQFMTRQFMTHLSTYMEGRVLRTQPRGRTRLCGRRYIMTVMFPSCASVPALSNS